MKLFLDSPVPAEHDTKGQVLIIGSFHVGSDLLCITDEGRVVTVASAALDMLWRYNYTKKTWQWVGDESEEDSGDK